MKIDEKIGQFGCLKMVDSSLKWCLVNCASSILELGANYRYLQIYSTIPMDSNNPKILAPIPSQ